LDLQRQPLQQKRRATAGIVPETRTTPAKTCRNAGLEEDGAERKHPDVPALWEEWVDAYMIGWEYARLHNLDTTKFAVLFRDIYLNLSHPDEDPGYPFSEVKERAIEEALKRYSR
jgi:hypothetical protein